MKKHLLFIFAALLPLVASAEKVEIDGIWYNLVSKAKQAEVTYKGNLYDSYSREYSGSITIPATVTHNGVAYSVTSIGYEAFRSCSSLTAITIPEGVTSIGNYAFEGCYSLTSITIPEGVTSIGSSAFANCSSLTAITIPEGVTSIGEWAFRGCENLTAITIPEGVTSIGDYAFANCSSLTTINIPESVTSIGDEAFAHCSSLYIVINCSNLSLTKGYSSNGDVAYYAKVVYQGGELTTVGDFQFYTSDGIHSLVNYIGNDTEIGLPDSYNGENYKIGDYAFYNCSSLTSINIPEGVTSIGAGAFYGCGSLTAITIPEGVTSIGDYTFYKCRSLTAINIPEGVTSIGRSAFSSCSSLTSITIPEGVTSIGEGAFCYCTSLTAINIPEGVTSIGNQTFWYCSSLTTIVLPKSVKSIYSEAFADCPELTDVYCHAEKVPSTNGRAFNGSYPEYATLHVPASAINSYKSRGPWSSFGTIIALGASITEITLSESSATLTEGEDLTLTMTTNPENADRNLISWSSSNPSVATVDNTGKVTAIAPGTTTITAMANDGSGVSALCEVTVNELILGTCATPTINYKDGKVVFACDTEGAIVKSNFKDNNASDYADSEVSFIPTYTITAYATKAQYENSDEVTLTLCWVPCKENHGDDNGILTIPSHPVLISTQGGTITLSGLAESTEVAVYTTAGTEVATATATNGTATLTTGLEAGSIAIVKIGNYSIKVAIK